MMKKKLVLVVVVVLCLSMLLAGCNMFTVNAERDNDQVVATVKHNGLVSEINKVEFASFFATNFQTYNYYYGWTAEEAGDNFISMIAKQKMIVTLAVEKFSEAKGVKVDTNKFNAINLANVKKDDPSKGYDVYAYYLLSLLNPDEQKYVKEQTNKSFEDAFDELVKEMAEADRIADTDDDDSNNKEPRPVQPKKEDNEFKADDSVTQADVDAIKDFFTEKKPNENSTEYEKDAYKDLQKNLEKQYRTYNYYLAKQAEARLAEKYSEQYKNTEAINIEEEFKLMLNNQEILYKNADSYKSAIESGEDVVVFHNGQYVKIKSILLKFTPEQEALLKYLQAKFPGEEQKDFLKSLREALVFGNINNIDLPAEINKELLGLKVYKSNPDYDDTKTTGDPIDNYKKDKDGKYVLIENPKPAEEMNYPYIVNPGYDPNDAESDKWLSVPFLDIISELGQAIKEVETTASKEYDEKYGATNDAVGKQMYINQKKMEVFEKYIYLVNDDPGMFEGKDYIETPFGNKSDYVAEFTGLVRQLLMDNATAGSVMVDTTTSEKVTGNIVKTQSKVGDDYVDIYTDKANNLSFVINDFGVHIVMLTNVPVDMGYNQEGKHYTVKENADFDMTPFENYTDAEKEMVKKANSFYTLTLDAYVDFDEETGKAVTLREKMQNSLKETYDAYTYSEHEKNLFSMYGDKVFDASDDKEPAKGYEKFKFEVSYNKSVFNSVVSEYKKLEQK